MNSGLTDPNLLQLAIVPSDPQTIYVTGFGGVHKSTNGGVTWTPMNAGLPAGQFVSGLAIDPTNPQRVYVGVNDNGVFRTTDGGQNWTAFGSGLPLGEI